MIHNEVLDCIRARRSTRHFLEKQVEPELIEALLEAAVWAPSGGNSQTWLFTAISKPDVLQKLNELLREGFARWTPDDDYPSKQKAKNNAQNPNHNFFYHAPALIIASNRPIYQNAMADCSLALENLFLAAQSLGLGSCYINQVHWLENDSVLRDFLFGLGIPKEHVICSSAAVGYIARQTPATPRKEGTVNIVR
jgi:nitroreductase